MLEVGVELVSPVFYVDARLSFGDIGRVWDTVNCLFEEDNTKAVVNICISSG